MSFPEYPGHHEISREAGEGDDEHEALYGSRRREEALIAFNEDEDRYDDEACAVYQRRKESDALVTVRCPVIGRPFSQQ